MAIRNQVFRDYLDAYRDAVRATTYADLPTLQPAPFASLNTGGAGTAYALWRLGRRAAARTWIVASRADRRKDAFEVTADPAHRRVSMLFGAAGQKWVHALIAPSAREEYARAIASKAGEHEVANGAAGWLIGALRLLERAPDPALERAASRLAHQLEHALEKRQALPWTPTDATGFAHGWPGICYGVLAWGAHRGTHAPWLLPALVRLAEAWAPTGAHPDFTASWCNGAAGALLLWTKAFAVSRDPRFLDVARRTADTAIAASGTRASLCCGDVGVAFALLSLARVDRRGPWRTRARMLAAATIARPAFHHPSGLFQGHPGLACLAADLLDEARPRGFPLVEG